MPRDDGTRETGGRSSRRNGRRLFHLPEGSRIFVEDFGTRREVDPDSPEGDRAILGLIACIAFQAVVAVAILMGTAGTSSGIEVVNALVMVAAFAVIASLVVSLLRGSEGSPTPYLRAFCVLVLVGIVLALAQNIDNPSQVVTGIVGIAVCVLALMRMR